MPYIHSSTSSPVLSSSPMDNPVSSKPNTLTIHPRSMASSLSKSAAHVRHSTNLAVPKLKAVLSTILKDRGTTLISISDLHITTHPTRLSRLNISDGTTLQLSLPPSPSVRLLRHETSPLYSEAVLLSFINTYLERDRASSMNDIPVLAQMVPMLYKYWDGVTDLGSPYSITSTNTGVPLSNISTSLTERASIGSQIKNLARSLAKLVSPNGRFGMVDKVLPNPFSTIASKTPALGGSETWAEAFGLLLEMVLSDGEAMAINLPYSALRTHLADSEAAGCFDTVTVPRLVVLDTREINVMVKRGELDDAEEVRVTGLRSWSGGIFGDPLMSCCSWEIDEGWTGGGGERKGGEEARRLMYGCYFAVLRIMTEYYRPRQECSKKEMEARRRLTTLLGKLKNILN